jgi:hypothetical protein
MSKGKIATAETKVPKDVEQGLPNQRHISQVSQFVNNSSILSAALILPPVLFAISPSFFAFKRILDASSPPPMTLVNAAESSVRSTRGAALRLP